MASEITIQTLVAVAGFGQLRLNWEVNDPYITFSDDTRSLDVVEIWRSTSNNRDNASKETEIAAGKAPNVTLDGDQTYYYWARARAQDGEFGEWHPVSRTGGVSGRSVSQTNNGGSFNGKYVVSVAGNNLTFAVKTKDGNDPSPTNPVFMSLPSVTGGLLDGSQDFLTITAPLSLVLYAGSTLGVLNVNDSFEILIYAFNNGGTVQLAAINETLEPYAQVASATSDTAGAADSRFTFYTSGSSFSNKAGRPIAMLPYAFVSVVGNYNSLVYDLIPVDGGFAPTPLTPWNYYTYTPAASSGTLTTASGSGFYKLRGNTVDFITTGNITTNGSGATAVELKLPIAVGNTAGVGFLVGLKLVGTTYTTVVGKLKAAGDNRTIQITNLDGSYPGVDSSSFLFRGTYFLY